ncbi:NHL repeat protein [Legionella birminghamensis]|uniref:NHL repeat protein n=1 Tax=Legionella birminghamensis TaxID=28083 RepID=A0A378IL40_9GAMM|nr:DUF1566 domain-containing protein [Legionella birminghamensis]KTC72572.1 NHL repeat protein [Legionella birminghamensis]STX32844.1 NHL repeat protein [Legionella birminghamensis]
MQGNYKLFGIKKILIVLLLGLMSNAFAGSPLWTFEPLTATAITVPTNGKAIVQYRVTNQSARPHILTMRPIQGITQITSGPGLCGNPFVLSGKTACILSLEINGSQINSVITEGPAVCTQGNPNQCYQPGINNRLHITRSQVPPATLKLSPTTLRFTQNSTGNVIVTNDASSLSPAINIAATIPNGSAISIQSTTCGSSLAVGASCTITFASGTPEGPTTIRIAGDNTNITSVDVTVSNQVEISITNPLQQARIVTVSGMTPLSLEITNSANSIDYANAITVSNNAACPNLSVNDSDCASVAPGGHCTLELSSSAPYAPCMITISGTNTTSPQTLIAFYYLGGLVFEESGGIGKIVIDQADNFFSLWTGTSSDIVGSTSFDDGLGNTNAIVVDASCSNDPGNCAAQRCRDIGADWYLPARSELTDIHSALCSNAAFPCNFGGLSGVYWSSTQQVLFSFVAWGVSFPSGADGFGYNKDLINNRVRCIRAFA